MAEQWESALVGRRLVSFGFVNGTRWDIGLRVKASHLQFAILVGVHHIVLGALGDENHVTFRKGQSFAIQYRLAFAFNDEDGLVERMFFHSDFILGVRGRGNIHEYDLHLRAGLEGFFPVFVFSRQLEDIAGDRSGRGGGCGGFFLGAGWCGKCGQRGQ